MAVLFGGVFGVPVVGRLLGVPAFVGVSIATFVMVGPLAVLIATRGQGHGIRDQRMRIIGTSTMVGVGLFATAIALLFMNRWAVLVAASTTMIFISYAVASWRSTS